MNCTVGALDPNPMHDSVISPIRVNRAYPQVSVDKFAALIADK